MSIYINKIATDTLVDFFSSDSDRVNGDPNEPPVGLHGNRRVQNLKVGEYVPVYDPSTGQNTRRKITSINKQENQVCKKAAFNTYAFIIYNSNCELNIGDSAYDQNGNTVVVQSIEDVEGTYDTYSLTLEEGDNYQANDIVVNI